MKINSKSNRGAMELSVGTIVVFVLAMSVLVLGFFLVQRIFDVATGAVDLTDQQLRNEINRLFSADEESITIYPGTKMVEIRQGESDGVGIGIRNLGSRDVFGYSLKATPGNDCSGSFLEADALGLITIGSSESDIPIAEGDVFTTKVILEPSVGDPLCIIRYRVYVTSESGQEFNDFFDIKILPTN